MQRCAMFFPPSVDILMSVNSSPKECVKKHRDSNHPSAYCTFPCHKKSGMRVVKRWSLCVCFNYCAFRKDMATHRWFVDPTIELFQVAERHHNACKAHIFVWWNVWVVILLKKPRHNALNFEAELEMQCSLVVALPRLMGFLRAATVSACFCSNSTTKLHLTSWTCPSHKHQQILKFPERWQIFGRLQCYLQYPLKPDIRRLFAR